MCRSLTSFSSHRHSYISFCLVPVFSINNKRKKVNLDVEIVTVWPHLPRPQFLTHTWTQVNRLSESHQQSFYDNVRETDVCKCVWHSVSFTPSPLPSPLTTSPDQSSVWEDSIFSNFRSSSFITPTTSSSSPLSRHFIRYNKKQGTPHRTGVFWGSNKGHHSGPGSWVFATRKEDTKVTTPVQVFWGGPTKTHHCKSLPVYLIHVFRPIYTTEE